MAAIVLSSESSTTAGSVKILAIGFGIICPFFIFLLVTNSSTVFLHNSEGKIILEALFIIALSTHKNILLILVGWSSTSLVNTPEYQRTIGIFSALAAIEISQGK